LQMVDLSQKAMAPGEIRRFIEKWGLTGLLDVEGKSYIDAGLKYLKVTDAELLQKIERDPKLLRLPLVRAGNKIAIGQDEECWKAMAVAVKG
jgi:arsenate reductase (glutaredoxin)